MKQVLVLAFLVVSALSFAGASFLSISSIERIGLIGVGLALISYIIGLEKQRIRYLIRDRIKRVA